MIKINYEINKKKDKGHEYTPANERIKAIRASAIYNTKIVESNLIEVPTGYDEKNPKATGWFVRVVLKITYLLGFEKITEKHNGEAFQVIDGKTFGTPSAALASAQTLAVSKALGHAGIGVDDSMATLEELQGNNPPLSTDQEISKLSSKIENVTSTLDVKEEPKSVLDNSPPKDMRGGTENTSEQIWSVLELDETIGIFFKDKKLEIKRRSKEAGAVLLNGYREDGLDGFYEAAKKQKYHTKYPKSELAKAIIGAKEEKDNNVELNTEREKMRVVETKEEIPEEKPETEKIVFVLSKDSAHGVIDGPDDTEELVYRFATKSNSAEKITTRHFINIGVDGKLYPIRVKSITKNVGNYQFTAKPEDEGLIPSENTIPVATVLDATLAIGKPFDIKKDEKDYVKQSEAVKEYIDSEPTEKIEDDLPISPEEKGYNNLVKLRETLVKTKEEDVIMIVEELGLKYQTLSKFVKECSEEEFNMILSYCN